MSCAHVVYGWGETLTNVKRTGFYGMISLMMHITQENQFINKEKSFIQA
jgi:hypothetical protein